MSKQGDFTDHGKSKLQEDTAERRTARLVTDGSDADLAPSIIMDKKQGPPVSKP